MTFGQKVCLLRKQKGYSQDILAEKTGVSRQAVSKWELDETLPDIENTIKIAKLFSVTTDYLLKEEIETKPKRTIPMLPDKYDTIDFLAALSAFGVSLAASCLYRFRLFWVHYAHDDSIKYAADFYPYKSWIWYNSIDKIIILAVLILVMVVSLLVAGNLNKKRK